MLHDHRTFPLRRGRPPRPAPRELGYAGIGWRMLGGAGFGLALVELIGRVTHHPGVASILGAIR